MEDFTSIIERAFDLANDANNGLSEADREAISFVLDSGLIYRTALEILSEDLTDSEDEAHQFYEDAVTDAIAYIEDVRDTESDTIQVEIEDSENVDNNVIIVDSNKK